MHVKYEISTKVAIYSVDNQNVLVLALTENKYGLPGGHMEEGEDPDDAMARELYEELGVRDVAVERRDFFRHQNGRMILAYTARLDGQVAVGSTQDESEGDPQWVSRDQFSTLSIDAGYKKFVLGNWPD